MKQSKECNKLFFETGDILSHKYGFDGIAAFIPCGLTAFRVQCEDFIKNDISNLIMILDRNENNKIYDITEVGNMVYSTLNSLYSKGAKSIGMNSIRTTLGAGLSEKEVAKNCIKWIQDNNPIDFKIVLIDLRGGFERYCI